MRPRVRIIAATAVFLFCVLGASSASAWCGRAHEWILVQALRLAGNPEWVDTSIALANVTEPDHNRIHPDWHSFHPTGTFRGGPQGAADEYYEAIKALAAGNRSLASLDLARMAHYFDDPVCPFHSQSLADKKRDGSIHHTYDVDLSNLIARHGYNSTYMLTARAPSACTNVRTRAIAAAKFGRGRYRPLRSAYKPGSIRDGSKACSITRSLLSRAANDLADVIRSMPTGSALSPPPATLRVTISSHHPCRGGNAQVAVACLDRSGKPMEGVRVFMEWPTATGTTRVQAYSEPNGTTDAWLKPGAHSGSTLVKVPKGLRTSKKYSIRISATSSGSTVVTTTWLKPT